MAWGLVILRSLDSTTDSYLVEVYEKAAVLFADLAVLTNSTLPILPFGNRLLFILSNLKLKLNSWTPRWQVEHKFLLHHLADCLKWNHLKTNGRVFRYGLRQLELCSTVCSNVGIISTESRQVLWYKISRFTGYLPHTHVVAFVVETGQLIDWGLRGWDLWSMSMEHAHRYEALWIDVHQTIPANWLSFGDWNSFDCILTMMNQ